MSKSAEIPGAASLTPEPYTAKPFRWFAYAALSRGQLSVGVSQADREGQMIEEIRARTKAYQVLTYELTPSDLRIMLAESEAWYRQQVEVKS